MDHSCTGSSRTHTGAFLSRSSLVRLQIAAPPLTAVTLEGPTMNQPRPRRRSVQHALKLMARLVGGALLMVLLASATLIGVLYVQGKHAPVKDSPYVALGSSFAAGPGIGTRAPGSPLACLRSNQNYAQLLAAERRLTLTDMTCTGATAKNVLYGGQYFQGAQVDALGPNTRLVTLTAGGNDVSYLGNLMAWSCTRDPGRTPLLWRFVCPPTPETRVEAELAALPDTLRAIVHEVRRRSPRATVVLVDYTTILPDAGACPERLPLSSAELERTRRLARQLQQLTAEVARDTGALLLKASDLTRGHDVCSAEPWVRGDTYTTIPLVFGPTPYHPKAQAMRAIADALSRTLTRQAGLEGGS